MNQTPNAGSSVASGSFSTSPSSLNGIGRKRHTPSAPVYSPNETLNQMTQEVFYFILSIYRLAI